MWTSIAPQERYFTVGHSTRSVAELVMLLQQAGADYVVDVRSIPRSRTNPQFNQGVLPTALAAQGIGYRHIAALGGLRKRRDRHQASANTFWGNASFRNYADYTGTAEFRVGLQELRELTAEHRPAIMCAEAVWWRCHRRIITDYLVLAGARVEHILAPGKLEPARLTESAVQMPDGTLIYPNNEPP